MQKQINAKSLTSLVKSFLSVSYDGRVEIHLNDPVALDKNEFKQLVNGAQLIEETEDDAYVYRTYRHPSGARLQVVYHYEDGIYWLVEVIVGQGQDS